MCEIDADGTCDVWDHTPVAAARKEHHCSCCGGLIPVGSPYVKHFSVYEGDPTHEKICSVGPLSCVAMMKAFQDKYHIVFTPSGMWDALRDCYAEDAVADPNDDNNLLPSDADGALWRSYLDAMEIRFDARRASAFYLAMAGA